MDTTDFYQLVFRKWQEAEDRCPEKCYSLDCWHWCLALLRSYLKGWNIALMGEQKKVKFELRGELERIDKLTETRHLSPVEWEQDTT